MIGRSFLCPGGSNKRPNFYATSLAEIHTEIIFVSGGVADTRMPLFPAVFMWNNGGFGANVFREK